MRKRLTPILLALLLSPTIALSETPVSDDLDMEVTITKKHNSVIEEFRKNGVVVMVKITPKYGYPYYLIDSDHDGSLETRRNHLEDAELVQWELIRF